MAAVIGKLTVSSRGILTSIVLPVHSVSWFIIFLTIPNDAPIVTNGTWLPTYVLPTKFLTLFAAFFIGVGEAVYQRRRFLHQLPNTILGFTLFYISVYPAYPQRSTRAIHRDFSIIFFVIIFYIVIIFSQNLTDMKFIWRNIVFFSF